MMKGRNRRNGFTMIEAIFSILVLAATVFALMNLFQKTISQAFITDKAVQASQLAKEGCEKVMFQKKAHEPNGYDYITSANFPVLEGFPAPYQEFFRSYLFVEVRPDDLTTPQVNSGYKRVTCRVTYNNGTQNVTLDTLVTKWNE